MLDIQSFEVFQSRLDNFYFKYAITYVEATDFTKKLQHNVLCQFCKEGEAI